MQQTRSLLLTVTDVDELSAGWDIYPEQYEALIGYSCLTPESGDWHIKQYKVTLRSSDGEMYILYTVSYDAIYGNFSFELPGLQTLNHVPFIGETIECGNFRIGTLPVTNKPLKIVSPNWCCLPTVDGQSCYCHDNDKPFEEIAPMLCKI